MIHITIKDNEFSYDLKALAMVFFPEQECHVEEDPALLLRRGFTMVIRIDGEKPLEEFLPAPYTKNEVKQKAYHYFSRVCDRTLPWGILTGIRPAKIPFRRILEGKGRQEILQELEEEYFCVREKAQLAVDVAGKEVRMTQGMDHERSVSIYIGIPFCPSICAYCSFSSYPLKQYENKTDAYLDALEKEITYVGEHLGGRRLQTVYIGGGTPTSLTEAQLERLFDMIEEHFPLNEVREYTVEAGRPDSITEGKLRCMRNHKVSRISINPQSMKQNTLDLLGRRHTTEQIRDTFQMARNLGFDNINMDLILGLPEETLEDFKYTLSEVDAMGPDSITIHTLVIKRASRIRKEKLEQGGKISDEDACIPQMQEYSEKFCREHGYEPYYMYRQKNKAVTSRNTNQENVAYARPGKECIYNVLMMEELQTILALGCGGSSKYVFHEEDRMERVENVKSVDDYISRIDEMIQRKLPLSSE